MDLAFQFLITVKGYVMKMLHSIVYMVISRVSAALVFAYKTVLVSSSILQICLTEHV